MPQRCLRLGARGRPWPTRTEKSLREVQAKRADLELRLVVTVDDDAYRAAVVATVAANLHPRED